MNFLPHEFFMGTSKWQLKSRLLGEEPVFTVYVREDAVQWAYSLPVFVFCILGQVTSLITYVEQSDRRIFSLKMFRAFGLFRYFICGCSRLPPSLKRGLRTGRPETGIGQCSLILALARARLWLVPLCSCSVFSSTFHSYTNV